MPLEQAVGNGKRGQSTFLRKTHPLGAGQGWAVRCLAWADLHELYSGWSSR